MFNEFPYSEDELITIFAPLSTDGWASLQTIDAKQDALQKIVDLYAQRFIGIKSLCKIEIVPFFDDNYARYEPSINTILLREDMLQNGYMKYNIEENYVQKEQMITYEYPAKHAFFYAMHEFRHAMQRYWIAHPETCPKEINLRTIKANQANRDLRLSRYIKSKPINSEKINIASINRLYPLYLLQPVERDAWSFAHRSVEELEEIMKELFSNDPAFQVQTKYSSFEENLAKAYGAFKTSQPEKDIDDIFLAIDGSPIDQRLNERMYKTWVHTQNEYMCKKIEKARNAVNERVRRRELLEEQEQQQIDSLFEEIERK